MNLHRYFIAIGALIFFSQYTIAQNTAFNSMEDTTVANEYFDRAMNLSIDAQYDSSNIYFNKAGELFEKVAQKSDQTHLWEKCIKCYNNSGVNLRRKGNYDHALVNLNKALEIGLRKFGEKHLLVAESYNNIGVIYRVKSDFDRALEFYNKSLSIRLALLGEQHTDVADSYNNIGIIYDYRGDYDRALEFYSKSLSIRLAILGEQHTDVADSYNNFGIIYKLKGDYDKAIEFYNKALSIRLAKLGEKHIDVAASYLNIGVIYKAKGDYDRAIEFYNKALSIFLAKLGDQHRYVAMCYNNLGIVYELKGDYDNAIEFHNKAFGIRMAKLDKQHIDLATSYHNFGTLYIEKKDYTKAIEFFTKALSIRLVNLGEQHPDVATNYNNIGVIYKLKGDYDRAIEFYNKALSIRIAKLDDQHPDLAMSYTNFGSVYGLKGDYDKAIDFSKKALSIYKGSLGNQHPDVAMGYNNLGEIYYEKGDYNTAIDLFRKAVRANILGNIDVKLQISHLPDSVLSTNMLLASFKKIAQAYSKRYIILSHKLEDLEQAVSTYQYLFTLIDKTRTSYQAEGSKIFLSEESTGLYDEAIQASLNLYEETQDVQNKEKSFLFAEKSKARILLEAFSDAEAKKLTLIPDSLLQLDRQLRIDLAFYERNLIEERLKRKNSDSSKIILWQNKVFKLKQSYDDLKQRLETDFPEYYDLKYETKTASVANIQSAINDKTALVEYFFGDSLIYIFVITKDKLDIKSIRRDSNFNKSLNSLVNSLKSVSSKAEYFENAVLVYKSLIAPVESQIADNQKLIIIPDGELYKVPFEALLSKPVSSPEEVYYTDIDYLVKEHEISYHYSATLYLNRRNESQTYEKDFVGFAPVFSKGNSTLASSSNSLFSLESLKAMWDMVTSDGKNLDELKYSESEVTQIRDMFSTGKSRIFVHLEASEENFKKNLRSTRYVHVATHGFMRSENPKLSNLAFSQPDSTDKNKEDGILYSGETYNLDIDADLLVLSACQTGTGKLVSGEGVMALTRGFLYSGANNIIASLWRVFDEHTSLLMIELYKQILECKSYSAALRGAKLKMIQNKTTARPQSWASFILIGK